MSLFTDKKLSQKRVTGEFFTSEDLAKHVSEKILSLINPTMVFEPYAGDGKLLYSFFSENIPIIANDIDSTNFNSLMVRFAKNNARIYNYDIFTVPNEEIISKWIKPSINSTVLIFTNPPFGSSSTNKLATKKTEKIVQSRSLSINYSNLDQFGKGDLILPSVGKCITLFQNLQKGYFAFFSPLGIFCKRKRYNKLLNALLNDFEFIWGEIFSGELFYDVNKKKPIAITVWKFSKNIKTPITFLSFLFKDKVIHLKPSTLLKDYWKYDTRKKVKGEIVVQGNDRFNVMAPKMFHLKVEKGGSELVPENILKPLKLGFIPDELAIGLWSVVVGYRSLTDYPIYVDNAYVHLPNFFQEETQQILTLIICSVLITELANNYTFGKIGFDQNNNVVFGSEKLSEGAMYLLKKFENVQIGAIPVIDFLQKLKSLNIEPENVKTWKKILRERIEFLLVKINYWGFIPIPDI